MANDKQFPKVGAVPRGQEPRALRDPSEIRKCRPIWRSNQMDLDGRFGWRLAKPQCLLMVQQRLASIETMTWGEIEETVKNSGAIPLSNPKFNPYVRIRLGQIGRHDVDTLYKLRITESARVWGIRHEEVFSILWWDPRHNVFQSKKWRPE